LFDIVTVLPATLVTVVFAGMPGPATNSPANILQEVKVKLTVVPAPLALFDIVMVAVGAVPEIIVTVVFGGIFDPVTHSPIEILVVLATFVSVALLFLVSPVVMVLASVTEFAPFVVLANGPSPGDAAGVGK